MSCYFYGWAVIPGSEPDGPAWRRPGCESGVAQWPDGECRRSNFVSRFESKCQNDQIYFGTFGMSKFPTRDLRALRILVENELCRLVSGGRELRWIGRRPPARIAFRPRVLDKLQARSGPTRPNRLVRSRHFATRRSLGFADGWKTYARMSVLNRRQSLETRAGAR
jgi:hypothetical protein